MALGHFMVHEDAPSLFSLLPSRNPRRFCPNGVLAFFDASQCGLASVHVSEYQQTRDTLSTATQQGLPTAFAEANVYIPYIISRYGRTCSSSSLQSPPWCASDIPSPDAPLIHILFLKFFYDKFSILTKQSVQEHLHHLQFL